MRKLLLVFVFVGLFNQFLSAQTGHYFLSHYRPGNDNISYLSFDIQQDNNGILYFANRSGVLQFDGRTWAMVPIKGAVYSLTVTAAGEVYAGGSAGFGKIGFNDNNQLSYLPLSDSLTGVKNIFATYSKDSSVYFLNEENFFQFDMRASKARVLFSATESQGLFTGLYQIGHQIFLATENEGLKMIEGQGLKPAGIPQLQRSQLIFSKQSPDGKTDLIATEENHFFLQQEGQPLREFKPKDSLYLSSNIVANCAWVTENMVAIGTLRGGVVFVDTETRETLEISNYYAGLPDNEVYALHTDEHKGLWVAHDYGFTRIDPFLPFRTFNHYPGLVGNLLSVQSLGNQVYVGTTLGLFLLSKDEIFEDEVYNVTQTLVTKAPAEEVKQERAKIKRGLFGLRKKKNPPVPEPVIVKTSSKKIQIQKTRRVLKGVEYVYKRVAGISGKVEQLVVVEKKLMCGGVGGVFQIDGVKSIPVNREPSRAILYSKNLKQLFISTYADGIKSFRPSGTGWQRTEFPDSLSIHSDYMFEDNLQDLWICGRDRAIKVGIEEGKILDAEIIPLPHTSVDRTVGLAYGQEVYITQNGEFYHYVSFKNSFVKYDSLPGLKKYFASAGYLWFYDGHKWRTVDPKLQGSIKTEWLALFPDIRFLAPAEEGKSLWVVTASNELYKLSSDKNQSMAKANPLFLKEVRSQQFKLSPLRGLMVDELESALTFEFIQPEYVSLHAVEYRYWVKGLQSNWSEWSTLNNIITFPFLPPGKYKVLVQTKDLFDKITELDTIEVNVVPPYWKRPPFYALEFFFFGALVVLSLRLKGANTRYRYLSRFLSALTVIMLIQFIQTIASANISFKSTPVVDFFIQVLIALLVLPVEEFLRGRILKADKKGK